MEKSKRLTGINIYVTNTPWEVVPMEQIPDVRGIIRTLLQDMDYVVVEKDKSFITDAFVEQVIVYLEKIRFFINGYKWIFLLLS